jgi:uncharacterized DUF497 family protein
MAYTSADLDMVDRHIVQGERHVTQQEKLVQRLRKHGLPTASAESLLDDFRAMLVQHREHREIMLHDIGSGGA